MSEQISKGQMRSDFIGAVKCYVNYWSNQDVSKKDALDGLAFGILNIIDGMSGSFPCAIDLVMRPHPEDKQYNIDNDDDYIEDGMVINDDVMLHDGLYR